MGTRALIHVFEGSDKILCLYYHNDGYPSHLGKILRDFIRGKRMVNGIRISDERERISNGMGDFAAQLLIELRRERDGVYVMPVTATDAGQIYEYTIRHSRDDMVRPILECKKLVGDPMDGDELEFVTV